MFEEDSPSTGRFFIFGFSFLRLFLLSFIDFSCTLLVCSFFHLHLPYSSSFFFYLLSPAAFFFTNVRTSSVIPINKLLTYFGKYFLPYSVKYFLPFIFLSFHLLLFFLPSFLFTVAFLTLASFSFKFSLLHISSTFQIFIFLSINSSSLYLFILSTSVFLLTYFCFFYVFSFHLDRRLMQGKRTFFVLILIRHFPAEFKTECCSVFAIFSGIQRNWSRKKKILVVSTIRNYTSVMLMIVVLASGTHALRMHLQRMKFTAKKRNYLCTISVTRSNAVCVTISIFIERKILQTYTDSIFITRAYNLCLMQMQTHAQSHTRSHTTCILLSKKRMSRVI